MQEIKKISQLDLGVANKDSVVPATNAQGTTTEKIKLGDIANLTTSAVLTYSSTIQTDASTARVFDTTLSGNAVLAAPTNGTNGQRCLWRIRRSNGQVLTLNSAFRIINGNSLDNTDNTTTYLDSIYDSDANRWDTFLYSNKPATFPSAPTNLSASTNGNANQIDLSWTAPTFTGNLTITDYVVQGSTNGGTTWTTIIEGISPSTSVTLTDLEGGTEYVFRVAAVNSLDVGPYTLASDPVTPLEALVPGAPTSVTGLAGDAQVALSWTAPTFTGNVALTDYVVQYSDDDGETWTTFSDATSTTTSATVTGLTNGTAYVFRVAAVNSVGTGDYSATSAEFTPAPALLPALLLHFDGANGSTTFTDSSLNNLSVVAYNNAAISTTDSKFGGASVSFPARVTASSPPYDGDALRIGPTTSSGYSELVLDDDFTVECWVKFGPMSNESGPLFYAIAQTIWQGSGTNAWSLWHHPERPNKISFWADSYSSGSPFLVSSSSVTADTWYHVAVTRSGNVFKLWINGAEEAAATQAVTITQALSGIGMYRDGQWSQVPLAPNYIDEFRVIDGAAVYTTNFTPPTAPFADPVPFPSLLLHFDGADGASVFTDSSTNALTVTATGATTSTTQSKFGGSSGYFSDAHLAVTDSNGAPIEALSFGAGPFTVDFWVYVTGGSQYKNILEFGTSGAYPATRFGLTIYPNEQLQVENFAALLQDPTAFPTDAWVHVAVTRDAASMMRLFINGVVVDSDTVTQEFTANIARIGKQWSNEHFTGYMDELRIIKGAAVYTANFTPPTAPYGS